MDDRLFDHPRPGEATQDAASRRLTEEMGFSCPLTPLQSLIYRADVGNGLVEHEFVHIFTGCWQGTVEPAADRGGGVLLVAARRRAGRCR